ncbi:MAG: hypothetical protein KF729_11210 [Sandaracinaceae bacterium]|nr:hypothetical protein [Sandaracinaceae bacterium]
MRAPTHLALAALLFACEGGSSPAVRIEIIDPAGENAAQDVIDGTLTVRVTQAGASLCADGCSSAIAGGAFDLALPLENLVDLMHVRGRITGAPTALVGAMAPFAIAQEFETGELPLRLVMMPPGTCAPVSLFNVSSAGRPRLVEPRRDLGVAVRRNVVLLVGGRHASGGSNRADLFDQIVFEMRPPLSSPGGALGPTRALRFDENTALFVGQTAWIYESQPYAPPAAVPVSVHEGAGFASALALLRNTGAVIGGEGTNQVSWMTARTVVATTELREPRAFAAAAAGGEGVLVVGGGPGAEWIGPVGAAVSVGGFVPESIGGWVAVSPSGRTFLAIGGSGAETTLVTGCPACVASPGPTWSRARSGASAVQTAAGALWIVGGEGSDAIDRVVWDGETPRILEDPAFVLSGARAGAAVAEHAAGVVLVVGGEGPGGMLDGAELCTPPEGLDP